MIVKEKITVGSEGELKEAEIEYVKKVSAEQFTQIYLQDNEQFYSLSKAECNVISTCWLVSAYYGDTDVFPGNVVNYNKDLLKLIQDKTKLSESTIKHAFATLTEKGMLIKSETRGVYYLNPKYFFKGSITRRNAAIKITTNYIINNEQ